MLLPCFRHVIAMRLPYYCHALLPCYCHAILPCCCYAIAMLLQCYGHAIAMLLPCYCNSIAMLLQCYCHASYCHSQASQSPSDSNTANSTLEWLRVCAVFCSRVEDQIPRARLLNMQARCKMLARQLQVAPAPPGNGSGSSRLRKATPAS